MKAFFKIIKFSFKISKSFYFYLLLSIIIYSAKALLLVYTPTILLSALERGVLFKEVVLIGLSLVIINALVQIISNLLQNLISYKRKYISLMYDHLMADKVMSLSYEKLEDPEVLDLKERAVFAVKNQGSFESLLIVMVSSIQSLATLITLIGIMTQLGYVLILLVLGYLIIYIILTLIIYKIQRNFFVSLIPVNRKFGYYVSTLTDPKNAKDYRLYNADELVMKHLTKFQQEIADEFSMFYRKSGLFSAIIESIRGLIQGGIYFYVAFRLYKQLIKASSFSLFASSAISFLTEVQTLIFNIVDFNRYLYYVMPFMEILSMPDAAEEGSIILDKEIEELEFRNVSFKYPRQDNLVLDDISFKINKGELISLVGLNGAGKTTIIKLICRLYKPISGEIYINNININDYELTSYNKHISCVFQDYKLFGYSIAKNITGQDENSDKAYNLLEDLGLKDKIDSLENGIETVLNKQLSEDATNFSGGQEQKIAIARALYKNSDFVILDEPTSALDPKSEAEIYENFNVLTKGKTAIYVSHRMSSSTFCDKILVIENGKVVAFDSHQNLMKKGGLYQKLFETQAKNYEC